MEKKEDLDLINEEERIAHERRNHLIIQRLKLAQCDVKDIENESWPTHYLDDIVVHLRYLFLPICFLSCLFFQYMIFVILFIVLSFFFFFLFYF